MHRVWPGAAHVSRPAGRTASSASLGITVLIMNLKYHSLIPFHSYVLPRRALTGVGTFYNMALLTKCTLLLGKIRPTLRIVSQNMFQNELESKKSTPICLWKNDRRRRCLSPLVVQAKASVQARRIVICTYLYAKGNKYIFLRSAKVHSGIYHSSETYFKLNVEFIDFRFYHQTFLMAMFV